MSRSRNPKNFIPARFAEAFVVAIALTATVTAAAAPPTSVGPVSKTGSADKLSSSASAASLGTAAPLAGPGLSPINQSTADVKPGELAAKPNRRAGADLTATYVDSVRERADADRTATMDFEFAPWIALGKNYKADAYADLSREMNGYQESKLADARLGLLHNPITLSKTFKYRPKLTLSLPVDPVRREVRSFLGGVGLGNRFLFERGILSGFYQLSATKNFYRYTTTGLGESNPSYGFVNTLKTVLTFGKLYVDLSGSVTSAFTYENTPVTSFNASQEIGFGVDAFSVGIGHTNEDSLFKSNGADSNLSLFNANSSKFYVTAGITI